MTFRRVTVTVLEGKDLAAPHEISVDPYVVVSIGSARKHRHETYNQRGTANPVWNQDLVFEPVYLHQATKQPTHPFSEIRFAVWDWNRIMPDKHMGIVYMPIADRKWRDGETREQWLDLQEATSGKIKVRVTMERIYTERGAKKMAKFIHDWVRSNPGKAWSDPDFPQDNLSVSFSGKSMGVASWKRITELSKAPKLFEAKAQSGDVIQGALGDCWLLGAMSIVATRPKLIRALFAGSCPEEGFYVCKFFIQGEWRWIVIDDALPVTASGAICFGRCRDADTFWVPLLEKAYAKLFDSFEAIEAGVTAEGLLDLTGEGAESFSFDDPRFVRLIESGQIEDIMKTWAKSRFLMGVSRTTDATAGVEQDVGNGILAGHAYSVLDIKHPVVDKGFLGLVGNKRLVLVKLRNPWGEQEWKGAWSDGSKEWTPSIRKQLKHIDANDGIFWMEIGDFFKTFNRFSIVRMYSTKMSIFEKRWHRAYFSGEWDAFTGGGCMNVPTWTRNTQYGLHILDEKKPTTVFIYVSQPDRRLQQREDYTQSVGVYVLNVADEPKRKVIESGKFLKNTFPPWNLAPTFTNKRDVCLRVDLDAGFYVIMPTTFEAGVHMPFSMGIFAENKMRAWEITEMQEHGIRGEWSESSAGGPPSAGELARADKHHGVASFYRNPKIALRWKSAFRVADNFDVVVRVEALEGAGPVGLRLYRKVKLHRPDPLHEKTVLETIAPTASVIEHTFHLHKSDGVFTFVPFLPETNKTGKFTVSMHSEQAGIFLEMYH